MVIAVLSPSCDFSFGDDLLVLRRSSFGRIVLFLGPDTVPFASKLCSAFGVTAQGSCGVVSERCSFLAPSSFFGPLCWGSLDWRDFGVFASIFLAISGGTSVFHFDGPRHPLLHRRLDRWSCFRFCCLFVTFLISSFSSPTSAHSFLEKGKLLFPRGEFCFRSFLSFLSFFSSCFMLIGVGFSWCEFVGFVRPSFLFRFEGFGLCFWRRFSFLLSLLFLMVSLFFHWFAISFPYAKLSALLVFGSSFDIVSIIYVHFLVSRHVCARLLRKNLPFLCFSFILFLPFSVSCGVFLGGGGGGGVG